MQKHNKNNLEHQYQDQDENEVDTQNNQNTFAKICQIIQHSKTFKFHNIILYKSLPISPYILSSNGYINKFYQQQQQLNPLDFQQNPPNTTICMCLQSSCNKTLKFSNMRTSNISQLQQPQQQFQQQSLSQLLSEHEENCKYYYENNRMRKIQYQDLYENAHRIYNQQILKTYENQKESKLRLNWNVIEQLIAGNANINKNNSSNNNATSLIPQCYKSIDSNYNQLTKSYTSSLILSIFGWKLSHYINDTHNNKITLQCHYCGKQLSHDQDQLEQHQIDFYHSHHNWCMVKDKQYLVWKIMIKLEYLQKFKCKQKQNKIGHIISTNQQSSSHLPLTYTIPRTQVQLQAKQLQYQLYQHIQPYLQRIDNVQSQSSQYSYTLLISKKKKRIHQSIQQPDHEQNHQNDLNGKQYSSQQQTQNQYIQRANDLNQIAHKSQEIIKKFINFIKIDMRRGKGNNN